MANKKFIIIDGNSLLHRAWHALPPLTTKTGEITNAVYGFTMILLRVLKDLKPDYLAVAFDSRGPTFRHQEFKEYKAQRIKQPDEFYQQFPRVKEILENFGIKYLEVPGYEADDIIASLKLKTQSLKLKTIVVSGDLDLLQLVDKQTEVYTLKKGITEVAIYDEKAVKERYGLKPEQMIDFKALRGDPSDNILGVKGIGEKTALELIKKFGSLENLYQNLDQAEIKDRVKTILKEQKENAFFSKKLVTIKKNVPLKVNLDDLKMTQPDKEKIINLFQKLEFHSLLSRVLNLLTPIEADKKEEQTQFKPKINDYVLIDSKEKFENFLAELKKQKEFALDTETTGLNPFEAKLLGISFSWQAGKAFYLPINNFQFSLSDLKSILENPAIKKIGHNIKYDFEVLENFGIKLAGIFFDTMVAAYLLNPGKRTYSLDFLVFAEFGFQMTTLESLIGKKGKKQIPIEMLPIKKLADYSCADADYTWRLKQKLESQLKTRGKLWWVFEKIEMPLIEVLAKMEKNGLKIDLDFLKNLSAEVKKDLEKLETKIFNLTGEKFNLNSPSQLKDVLFNKLKIPIKGLSKTKTGVSTAASELDKLKTAHPVIPLILEYRELSKLYSTYLETLPKLVNPKTLRLHTSFNQTITATGRLSSSEPNLQNIPVRTELGKKIRQAFIAENGYSLISADYSQIELRIIASLSQDKKMIDFFQEGKDIHQMTAAEIKGLPPEKVTPEMRRLAKTVNFGIIYGLGRTGLAESAGISKEEAEKFIEKYFKIYHQVKEYIEKLKKEAQEKEYAETLFGRRRYLPEIVSDVQVLKAEAERAAINMPIQGLVADLIKLAMIELDKKLSVFGEAVKMVLQIHDELLFEVKDEKVKEVVKIIKEVMENPPIKLAVPIKVEIRTGKNWGTLKDFINF